MVCGSSLLHGISPACSWKSWHETLSTSFSYHGTPASWRCTGMFNCENIFWLRDFYLLVSFFFVDKTKYTYVYKKQAHVLGETSNKIYIKLCNHSGWYKLQNFKNICEENWWYMKCILFLHISHIFISIYDITMAHTFNYLYMIMKLFTIPKSHLES